MEIRGINLHVEVKGTGFPILLLHGLSSHLGFFQPIAEYLYPPYQIVSFDCRGHGKSDRPATFSLEDHIDDAIGVLDALNIEPVYILGYSMGSYIAMGVAIQQPERVEKLVLINPKAKADGSSAARFQNEHAYKLKGMSPNEIEETLHDHLFAPTTPPEIKGIHLELLQRQEIAGLALTTEENNAAIRALMRFDFTDYLCNIAAKTLVVSGKYDLTNPPALGQEIANAIPGARFEVLEKSGHMPLYEEPEKLKSLIGEFFGLPDHPATT